MRILLSLIAAAGLAGCYASDGTDVEYGGGGAPVVAADYDGAVSADYVQPEMVVVSPGIQVVYDNDYPVFFNEGFYWRYDGGSWYRSRYHDRGWAFERNVPYGVRGIDHPEHYGHYRPAGYVSHRQERRDVHRAEARGERRGERREEHRGAVHTQQQRREPVHTAPKQAAKHEERKSHH